MTDGAVCACLRVEYRPRHHHDGGLSDRWLCPSCGGLFVRRVSPGVAVTVEAEARRWDPDGHLMFLGGGGGVLIVGGVALLVLGLVEGLIPVAFGLFLVALSHGTTLGRLRACREIIEQRGRVAP